MKIRFSCLIFCLALSILPCASHAQSFFRTFVSGLGSDANPCTRTQPCQTFGRALTQTFAGGEIDVLDPGGYGPFTITKSISIVNDGAGVVGVKPASGADAITINASSTDAIELRGLTIEGAAQGRNGIAFNSGGSLTVEKTVIRNFTGRGISFTPSGIATLIVIDSRIQRNTGEAIHIAGGQATLTKAILNRVHVIDNGDRGIALYGNAGNSHVVVTDSIISGNASDGVYVTTGGSGLLTRVTVKNSAMNMNQTGANASGAGAEIYVSGTTVEENTHSPWTAASNGGVWSYGDNESAAVVPPFTVARD